MSFIFIFKLLENTPIFLAKTTDGYKEKRDDPKSFQYLTPFLSESSSERHPKLCHII